MTNHSVSNNPVSNNPVSNHTVINHSMNNHLVLNQTISKHSGITHLVSIYLITQPINNSETDFFLKVQYTLLWIKYFKEIMFFRKNTIFEIELFSFKVKFSKWFKIQFGVHFVHRIVSTAVKRWVSNGRFIFYRDFKSYLG